ncbi:hypothetical protein BaRGS_00003946 [Batillaria attramentaria]|uniref:Uncharacterized protein n=1 Tax=Batillaria attramentaria TaxID=370345 RepID=A0ABD0M0V2_9CAEN
MTPHPTPGSFQKLNSYHCYSLMEHILTPQSANRNRFAKGVRFYGNACPKCLQRVTRVGEQGAPPDTLVKRPDISKQRLFICFLYPCPVS